MFDEFDELMVPVAANVELRVRRGGSGPPVVLLHGHPRTHVAEEAPRNRRPG
jgi:haloacetate dehalogenase